MSSWRWGLNEQPVKTRVTDRQLLSEWDKALSEHERRARHWFWPFRLALVVLVIALPWVLLISGLNWIGVL